MKMYGKPSKAIHYKIYDAVANAKVKKTFDIAKFSQATVIKHEIKFLNPKKYFGKEVAFFDLTLDWYPEITVRDSFYDLLPELKSKIVFRRETIYKPIKDDVIHILYATIKNIEQKNDSTLYNQIIDLINNSGLSASQKSKRKKSIALLEDSYNLESKSF